MILLVIIVALLGKQAGHNIAGWRSFTYMLVQRKGKYLCTMSMQGKLPSILAVYIENRPGLVAWCRHTSTITFSE